jgi:glycosyltransferase involved in cell wall biosynthesis
MKKEDHAPSRTAAPSVKVLQIVGGMDTGGVETWLMHLLRRLDRDRYHFDFLTHTTKACFYDDEIRALGSRILPCMHPSRPWQYAGNFLRILKTYGPYDVVHSHVHHFSGFPLMLASWAGVPIRVAHSHNDTSAHEKQAGLIRRLYLGGAERLIQRYATTGLACSGMAATDLFGDDWSKDSTRRILYCGIDLEPFTQPVSREEMRKELGIPSDALVLGHVGRFSEQKNHEFLLDIFAEVARRKPESRLLLVGDGELRGAILQRARRLELENKVILAGVRPDIARLMKGAMDVFVFPSRWEGLGLVLLEAQAACLHCIYSDCITREVEIVPSLLHRCSLKEPASTWADLILAAADKGRASQNESLAIIGSSGFNIVNSLAKSCEIYG